jgi:hypothetical protein
MYSEFSTSNIQIDKDFTAKLSGYGCAGFNTEEISTAPVVCSFPSVEVNIIPSGSTTHVLTSYPSIGSNSMLSSNYFFTLFAWVLSCFCFVIRNIACGKQTYNNVR